MLFYFIAPPSVATYARVVAVNFTILGSGSNGNCAYLETPSVRLLIDAGFSGKQIRQRLASIGRTPEALDGILLTHEHSDHTKGLGMIAGKLGIPVYCNRLTLEAVEAQGKAKLQSRLFQTGSSFDVQDVTVDAFSIPHDAYDPVGFLIRTATARIAMLTDLGHATRMIVERVRSANVLVLETNYDLKMLQEDTRRPWSIKQRIISRHGHLSNDAAAAAAEEIVSENLSHVFLAHLSRDCNEPKLAHDAVCARMAKSGANHVSVQSTYQDAPNATLSLD